MDKEKYNLFSSIVLSYEGIQICSDENEQYKEKGIIPFVYNNKEFLLFIDIESQQMPRVFTSYQKDYPHYLSFNKKIGKREICLFDNTEFINSLIPVEDKIRIVIEKLLRLENLNLKEISKEYLKEFPVYWFRVCDFNKDKLQFYLSNNNEYTWLEARYFKHGTKKIIRFSSKELFFNDSYNEISLKHSKALFLKVLNTDGIFPPINGEKWNVSEIVDIVANPQISRISTEAYNEICSLSYSEKNLTLILEINNFYVACEIEFKNKGTAKLIKKIKNETTNITHRKIDRCDFHYLSRRIGNSNMLNQKRILLIGYGSLGSYIAEELIKSGCVNLSVYDNDNYEAENICRHKFGFDWYGCNKAKIAEFKLKRIHPQINVIGYDKAFDSDDSIDDFDMIISAVGSSDTQIKFNKIFYEKFIGKPVIYAWLEGDGKSSHVLCSFNNKNGCYNCCFIDNDGKYTVNLINQSTSDEIKYLSNCCGGVRVAYGTSTLLSASLITLKAIKDAFSSSNKESFVYHFTNERISKTIDIKKEGCELCSEN
ncbi:MAG: ThiF family adenylyltransferase [Ruminococcus sp.]|nr:ThiF family adenylyltransferase [Ruminococcus sp.]